MKTDELIRLMASDAASSFRIAPYMAMALLGGTCISAALLLLTIGVRPDIAEAISSGRVVFKLGVTLLSAALAVNLVFRVGRPGAPLNWSKLLLLVPPALVIAAVVAELLSIPASLWMTSLLGRNALICLVFIPGLSFAPLLGIVFVLRKAAPGDPGLAGAVAGLAASCVAASLYAWRCPDDSPLFLVVWYTTSILAVSGVGYLVGKRVLRW